MQPVESHSMGMDEKEERGKGVGAGNKGKSVVAIFIIRTLLSYSVLNIWKITGGQNSHV